MSRKQIELREKLIKSEIVYKGRVIDLQLDTVELPNGKQATREFVVHSQAVAILPITNKGTVLLVKQFRHCTGEELLEIPAGGIDEGEAVEAALQREMAEEIGCTAKKITKLCSVYTTPGFTNEFTHFYAAEDLIQEKKAGDEDEFIEVVEVPLEELKQMLEAQKFKDAKTVLAVSLFFSLMQRS